MYILEIGIYWEPAVEKWPSEGRIMQFYITPIKQEVRYLRNHNLEALVVTRARGQEKFSCKTFLNLNKVFVFLNTSRPQANQRYNCCDCLKAANHFIWPSEVSEIFLHIGFNGIIQTKLLNTAEYFSLLNTLSHSCWSCASSTNLWPLVRRLQGIL